jgi:probable F420-dependent oxidoreductase
VHAFRFAVQQGFAPTGEAWASLARRVESLGYDVLVMPDHLGHQLSPLVALTAAAAATTRLRVGAFVFANDYRHPLILAREAASLDLISGGRFELGLGAGWMPRDYRRLGKTYDPGPVRVDRLAESVPLVKRLLAGETVTHKGANYELNGASVGVETVQKPRPPLAIGAGGPRMLRLAAREAEIVGLTPGFNASGRPIIRQATDKATAEKVAIVKEAAGERFERLELNLWVGYAGLVGSGNSPLGSLEAAAGWAAARLAGSPYAMFGTLASVREQLLRRRDRLGISYYTIPGRAMESMAPLVEALSGK